MSEHGLCGSEANTVAFSSYRCVFMLDDGESSIIWARISTFRYLRHPDGWDLEFHASIVEF
jgi:hypothetical protein